MKTASKEDALLELNKRLESLSKLEEGWLGDGEGKPLDPEVWGYATAVGEFLIERGIYFYTFLTFEGGIQFEYFDSNPWFTTVEFMPQTKTVYFHTCTESDLGLILDHEFRISDGHLKNKIYTLLKLFVKDA